MRTRQICIALLLFPLSSSAHPAEKSVSWTDINFVLCEGMGITATGKVELWLQYELKADRTAISQLTLNTDYLRFHVPAARLEGTQPNGTSVKVNLQAPWFATIGRPDVKTLVLPRRANEDGPAAQTRFEIKKDSRLTIEATVVFPQEGGNCSASFTEIISVP